MRSSPCNTHPQKKGALIAPEGVSLGVTGCGALG